MNSANYGTCDFCRGPFVPANGDELDESFDDEPDFERDENRIERALDECGQTADGGCLLAGSEHCDWDCPFSL